MRLTSVTARCALSAVLAGAAVAAVLTGCSRPADGRGGDAHRDGAPGAGQPVDLREHITDFTDGITQEGTYRVPAERDRRAVADGVRALLDGDRAAAGRLLARAGYAVRELVDSDSDSGNGNGNGSSGRHVAEIADATADGEARRGWGRVYVDLRGPARWQVQVPHPTADQRTEQLGIGLLRGTPGGVLVLAGAHRNAAVSGDRSGTDPADVAHRRDSVFAAVSAALADRGLPAVQVHGFADSSLPDEDVVVSTGKGDAGLGAARRLAGALRSESLRVCEVWERYCGRLEGRTNVEGDHAASAAVPFLHVEHSRSVRLDDGRVAEAVRALTVVTREWAAPRG